jgi:hopene-associated glycosyltransferase HpnB
MTILAALSLLIWLYLLFGHGQFWRSGPVLPPVPPGAVPSAGGVPPDAVSMNVPSTGAPASAAVPSVAVVVPARDEAPLIGETLRSLLAQDYGGAFRVILVDDGSADGTGRIAAALNDPRLTVVTGAARPAGWSGKLWAVQQGVAEAGAADLLLLTDADIVHEPGHLGMLVAQAERFDLDLVSEMVRLACDSWAERALVPAFVFFFQLLYPFAWVNDGLRGTAAAAGGTILIRQRALQRIGGMESVRGALIDDVALAAAVKKGGRIWLGHATLARSVRPYPGVADIWRMVTRTAYVQLRYSPLLLLATTLAMLLTWIVPPAVALTGHGAAAWYGLIAWIMLTASYLPTLRRYGRYPLWAPFLPLVAAFYMAATIGAAANHYRGRGVAWKGRAYQEGGA